MDRSDLDLRNRTYGLLVELGRAPSSREVAAATGMSREEVRAGWRRLHEAHALVVDAGSGEIRMAHPFSAVPTAFRVQAAGRSWHANCAWDAFGICAALEVDGRIDSACPDCGEPLRIEVSEASPSDTSLLFHCLVPASRWWEDIAFT
ncbi:MAG TPA: organomercurial lyase [Thermoleophilaceae bacterium]|nr:organomercurial lyase [Thermoleophilaceae bacterium]